MVLKALGIWLLMAVLAVLNGTFREMVLMPLGGRKLAEPASGILLSLRIFFLTWLSIPRLGRLQPYHYWFVGCLWLVTTVLFEFTFGRFVAGKTWGQLLEAYDPTTGNLWIFVLLVMLVSPYLAARGRGDV